MTARPKKPPGPQSVSSHSRETSKPLAPPPKVRPLFLLLFLALGAKRRSAATGSQRQCRNPPSHTRCERAGVENHVIVVPKTASLVLDPIEAWDVAFCSFFCPPPPPFKNKRRDREAASSCTDFSHLPLCSLEWGGLCSSPL